ncbi:hypothetical protein CCH79_00006356, partial [Gambusia affinis]
RKFEDLRSSSNLLQVQNSGLHPGHLDLLVHLVDVPFDQAHRQRLHHQQLHLQEERKRQQPSRAVSWRSTCCPHADLKPWNFSTFPALKAYNVSMSHCLSVFLRDSSTGCISCRANSRTVSVLPVEPNNDISFQRRPHQLSEVVNSLPQESGQAQGERSLLLLCFCGREVSQRRFSQLQMLLPRLQFPTWKVFDVHAAQIAQRVLVVGGVVPDDAVILAGEVVEPSVDRCDAGKIADLQLQAADGRLAENHGFFAAFHLDRMNTWLERSITLIVRVGIYLYEAVSRFEERIFDKQSSKACHSAAISGVELLLCCCLRYPLTSFMSASAQLHVAKVYGKTGSEPFLRDGWLVFNCQTVLFGPQVEFSSNQDDRCKRLVD